VAHPLRHAKDGAFPLLDFGLSLLVLAGSSSSAPALNLMLLGVPDVRPERANAGFLTLSFSFELTR